MSYNMMRRLFLVANISNSSKVNNCRSTIASIGYVRTCKSYDCFLKLPIIVMSLLACLIQSVHFSFFEIEHVAVILRLQEALHIIADPPRCLLQNRSSVASQL